MQRGWEQLVTIVFVVVMTTSMVATPVLATAQLGPTDTQQVVGAEPTSGSLSAPAGFTQQGGPQQSGQGSSGSGGPGSGGTGATSDAGLNVTVPEIGANGSMAAVLDGAHALDGYEAGTKAELVALNETFAAINGSLQAYRGPNQVDSATAYGGLKSALQALKRLNGTDGVNRSSAHLYNGSTLSAHLAVAAAIRTYENNQDAFERRGQRKRTRQALENAVAALARADDAVSSGTPARAPPGERILERVTARQNAVTHHRTAWNHTQSALDALERAVDPELTVQQGQAIERNGSIEVTLQALLSDVRPYAYGNATVRAANGTVVADPIPFVSDRSAGGTASGMTTVDIGPTPRNLTVTVSAASADDPDRQVTATQTITVTEDDVLWERPGPDEYQTVAVENEATGVNVTVGGEGIIAPDFSVTNVTPDRNTSFRAGPMVRVENETAFDTAEVTMSLGANVTEQVQAGRNLSLYTWDPSSDQPWTPVETTIDVQNGTATATVDHFSFFSLFWVENWEDATSDTVVLEDQPDAGDGETTIRKGDFVFVMDESGSMGGSPISYARTAAQRFVGALVEDERAAMVGFDYGSSLYQGLTTDHDAVNASVGSLNAYGGTNVPSGLSTGLSHLTNNGWDNRSQIMILLSDGKSNRGGDPADVARTAEDRGVEISTIGLGNGIDEGELREIAGITGGDFYHVQSASELPKTFERVEKEQSGPQLRDTNGDGIPDRVAEMDLTMPTGGPGVVGTPLNLDPIALDTDSDGIPDSESVNISYRVYEENGQTKLTAQVTNAIDHPARKDTTGNGFGDARQVRGWDVQLVETHDDAEDLWEVVTNRDDDRDPAQFFSERTVHANPLVTNSDGDELSDAREYELGTDPQRADTVGDDIPDHEAVQADREDPTMFTTTPPRAWLTYYDRWSELPEASLDADIDLGKIGQGNLDEGIEVDADVEGPQWYFRYRYTIEDNAGVGHYELKREGNQIGSGHGGGRETYHGSTTHESFIEGSLTALRGSQSHLTVNDVHGNDDTVLLHSEQSFYGSVLNELGAPGMAGAFSGFTHSAAGLPELLVSIGSDPGAAAGGFADFVGSADGETLGRLAKNVGPSVKYQMWADNPHADTRTGCDENLGVEEYLVVVGTHGLQNIPGLGSDCQKYAAGFYTGYVTHFAASLVYGGTITSGVSRAAGISGRLSSVSGQISSKVLSALGRGGTKTALTGRKILQASRAIDVESFGSAVDDLSTAGTMGKVRTAGQALSDSRRAALTGDGLGDFLADTGLRGSRTLRAAEDTATARFITNLGDGTLNRVLTAVPDASRRATILSRLRRVDTAAAQYAVADFTVKHGDVAVDDVISFANRHGEAGMGLLKRVDDTADVTRILSASDDTLDDLVELYRTDPDAAEAAVDFYTRADDLGYVSIPEGASLRPLVTAAQRGVLTEANNLVMRGGRVIWFQRIQSVGDVADEIGIDNVVFAAMVNGKSAAETEITADPDAIGYPSLDASEIVVTYDEDTGEVTDVELVE